MSCEVWATDRMRLVVEDCCNIFARMFNLDLDITQERTGRELVCQ